MFRNIKYLFNLKNNHPLLLDYFSFSFFKWLVPLIDFHFDFRQVVPM